jgi:hypothetical protein
MASAPPGRPLFAFGLPRAGTRTNVQRIQNIPFAIAGPPRLKNAAEAVPMRRDAVRFGSPCDAFLIQGIARRASCQSPKYPLGSVRGPRSRCHVKALILLGVKLPAGIVMQ